MLLSKEALKMSQRMEFKWCSLYQSDQAFLVGGGGGGSGDAEKRELGGAPRQALYLL